MFMPANSKMKMSAEASYLPAEVPLAPLISFLFQNVLQLKAEHGGILRLGKFIPGKNRTSSVSLQLIGYI